MRPGNVRRKPLSLTRGGLVTVEPQEAVAELPVVMRPAVEGVNLVTWAADNHEMIEAHLLKHGGILFRGFDVSSPEVFGQFVTACSSELLQYRERSSPRTQLDNNIYTSTDYPADQSIFLHNENSYQHTWPLKIFFCCMTPPTKGRETPIPDCRKFFGRIDPMIRQRFIEKGWMLDRNFGDGLSLARRRARRSKSPGPAVSAISTGIVERSMESRDGGTWSSLRCSIRKGSRGA